jgi:hypothetical protein
MIRLLRSGATGYWIPEAIVEHRIGRDRQTVRYIADYYESWTLLGAANSIIYVDPKDIARDTVWFLTVWSPGQYLLPDAISSLGVPWCRNDADGDFSTVGLANRVGDGCPDIRPANQLSYSSRSADWLLSLSHA